MWVIDIRHWLDETQSGPAVPQLRLKVKKLGEIIIYATSAAIGIPVDAPPRCWRRPQRKPCKGILEIDFDPVTNQIHRECPVCLDEGVITGWEGLIWDMRERIRPGFRSGPLGNTRNQELP